MLQRLKTWMGATPTPPPALRQARADALRDALGAPVRIDRGPDAEPRVDIHVFPRRFRHATDSATTTDGFVLVTSGMSDRLMSMPAGYDGDESAARELIWYVPALHADYVDTLRWLAALPFAEDTWLGHGHTVRAPEPPLASADFSTVLLLPPSVAEDRHLFDNLSLAGHGIEILAVHLISDAEFDLVRSDEGLDIFLDLLDVHRHPVLFDPARPSYL